MAVSVLVIRLQRALFTVGSGDLFQIDSSGAITAATGITSSGTITFTGNTLDFQDALSTNNHLKLLSGDKFVAEVFDPTNNGNVGMIQSQVGGASSLFDIIADFNDNTKIARLFGYVDNDESTITYTADTHEVIGNITVAGSLTQSLTGTSLSFVAETQGPVPGSSMNDPREVFVSGKYAYVTSFSSTSLTVIDISNPASPTFVAEEVKATEFSGIRGLFVSGKYAYIATSGRDSLAVVDISNPSDPQFLAETQGTVPNTTLNGAIDVFVSGKYAYVTVSLRNSLAIIDISNPANPTFVAETQGPVPNTTLNGARSAFVSGKYAYVISSTRDALAIFDISNPANPTFVAETQGPTPGTSLDGPSNIFVSGRYAYITATNHDSLAVIDISNPANPTFVAETQGPTPGTSLDGAIGLSISGKYAYVSSTSRDALAVIDISNPLSPTYVGETRGTTPGTTLDGAGGLFVSGKYVYLATQNHDSLAIIDSGGSDLASLNTGEVQTGSLNADYLIQGHTISAKNSILVGEGGILSSGPLSVSTTTIASYFGGSLGIGNTAPAVKLHVGSSAVTDGTTLLRLEDANSTCNFTADSGSPSCGSDRTLKKDITSLDTVDLLTRVTTLNPVEYRWKTQNEDDALQYGFIAQEVQEQFPDLVKEGQWIDGTTRLFLNIGGLMPYVVGSVKALDLKTTSIIELTEGDNSFVGNVRTWLASVENGIETIVAKTFKGERFDASGMLCIGQTCIDETLLKELIDRSGVDPLPSSDEGAQPQDDIPTEPESEEELPEEGSVEEDTGGEVLTVSEEETLEESPEVPESQEESTAPDEEPSVPASSDEE